MEFLLLIYRGSFLKPESFPYYQEHKWIGMIMNHLHKCLSLKELQQIPVPLEHSVFISGGTDSTGSVHFALATIVGSGIQSCKVGGLIRSVKQKGDR